MNGTTEPMSEFLSKQWTDLKPLLPTYIHLLVTAVLPIIVAAHASLRRPGSAKPAKKQPVTKATSSETESETEGEDNSGPLETLSKSDAILFPVLAGVTLTGLYLLIKWLEDPALLNKILGYYFNWVGTFFTYKFARDGFELLRSFVFPTQFSSKGSLYKHDAKTDTFTQSTDGGEGKHVTTSGLFGRSVGSISVLTKIRRIAYYKVTCSMVLRKPFSPTKTRFGLTILDLLAAIFAGGVSVLTAFTTKTRWWLTNLTGFSFCYGSLQFMTPGTSAVGSLLLGLLFFYDIYMVFYTPMMVTVATKLEVPIKMLFPRPDDGKRSLAMLGLGDIVVPGIMCAFALRFDLWRYYKNQAESNEEDSRPVYVSARGMWAEKQYTARKLWSKALHAKSFPKTYFKASIMGYLVGLVTTLLVMQVYKHAQPALLYLVPGVLTSLWGTALVRGEIKLFWEYDEAEEEKAEEKQEKDKEGEKKEETSEADKEPKKETVLRQPVVSFNVYLPPAVEKAKDE